jgi:hypothetical protein
VQTRTLPLDDAAAAASEGAHLDETEIEMIPVIASASILATAAGAAESEDADLAAAIEPSLGAAGDRGAAATAQGPLAPATTEPVLLILRSTKRSPDS